MLTRLLALASKNRCSADVGLSLQTCAAPDEHTILPALYIQSGNVVYYLFSDEAWRARRNPASVAVVFGVKVHILE